MQKNFSDTFDMTKHNYHPAEYLASAYLTPTYLSPATCSELIFPILPTVPKKLIRHRERSSVLQEIESSPELSTAFYQMPLEMQQAFLDFCMGNRGLRITYDPFFKYIFDHNRHPGRLDMLLSDILGQEVTVLKVEDLKRDISTSESSLIFMDILVKLKDGSLVNVEMQKIGLKFPVERAFCYGSDLLMRQYDALRNSLGQDFTYQKMNPVYVIVLIEESTHEFHAIPEHFIHRSQLSFDTQLELKNLIRFIFIPLDIFRKIKHNETRKEEHHTVPMQPLTRLDAWLCFLSSDHPEDMERIIQAYPFFCDIYKDIMSFQYDVNELMYMVPRALQIMDNNTIKLMIEEQKEKLAEERKKVEEERQKFEAERQKAETERQKAEAERQKAEAAVEEIKRLKAQNAALAAENESLKARTANTTNA